MVLLRSLAVLLVAIWAAESKPTSNVVPAPTEKTFNLLMPDVQPQVADTYLCLPTKVEADVVYIDEFDPHANMSTAHHMLLYGCEEPGEQDQVWNCGEMASETKKFTKGPVCHTGAQILYAWAMDAPKFRLPADVAFKVGASTSIKWLVLQVHYKDVTAFTPPNDGHDHSGITLHVTKNPRPKTAGVYLLGTDGELAPHSTTYMESACALEEPVTLHPFAYRVHAHTHGEVVSGYRVRNGEWEELGHMSPKQPQMFYNISNSGIDITQGDILAARCTMVNNGSTTIKVGSTQNDEMCNFYIMYWIEGSDLPEEKYCFTPGPPTWSWDNMAGLSEEQAPADASQVPSGDVLKQGSMNEDTEDTFSPDELYDLLREEIAQALYNEANLGDLDYDLGDDLTSDLWQPRYAPEYRQDGFYNQEKFLPEQMLDEYYPPVYESLYERLQRRL